MIPLAIKHTLVGGSSANISCKCGAIYHLLQRNVPSSESLFTTLCGGSLHKYHFHIEYCGQIGLDVVRMIEPASAINRATQCERESRWCFILDRVTSVEG